MPIIPITQVSLLHDTDICVLLSVKPVYVKRVQSIIVVSLTLSRLNFLGVLCGI